MQICGWLERVRAFQNYKSATLRKSLHSLVKQQLCCGELKIYLDSVAARLKTEVSLNVYLYN